MEHREEIRKREGSEIEREGKRGRKETAEGGIGRRSVGRKR